MTLATLPAHILEGYRRERVATLRQQTGGRAKIPLIDRYLWRGAAKRLHDITLP